MILRKKSLTELTELADNLIKNLENKKDLEGSMDDYQKILKINNLIQKKFQIESKNISEKSNKNKKIKNNEKIKFLKLSKIQILFLKNFLKKTKKSHLLVPIKYSLLPGGKIRTKLLVDIGKIFHKI